MRAADEAADLARLSLDVQRAEDIRAVKRLQISYAHYAQFGLWSEMALLFTSDAEAVYGADRLKGRAAIRTYLLTTWGNGREACQPVACTPCSKTRRLESLGRRQDRQGRWREFSMIGQLGGTARWEQGISENEYVKEEGVWKISRLDYYLETTGPYETGWVTGGRDVKLVPFHYTSAEAGVPIPPIPDAMPIPAITGTPSDTLAALDRRIQAMNDEDKVANLQNATATTPTGRCGTTQPICSPATPSSNWPTSASMKASRASDDSTNASVLKVCATVSSTIG